MLPSIPLLIQPIPYPDESAASFLCRLINLNKFSSLESGLSVYHRDLVQAAPYCKNSVQPRFQRILQIFNLDETYGSMALRKSGPTYTSPLEWNNVEVPTTMLKQREQPFCPLCLSEKPYFRKIWQFAPLYACTKHSVYLIDKCHICGEYKRLDSGELSICSNCSVSLDTAPTTHCGSIESILWLKLMLETASRELFLELTSYWFAIEQFAKLDGGDIPIEYQLQLTRQYFIDSEASQSIICRWINSRTHFIHPRIQLIPFLRHTPLFDSYIKSIEENCPDPLELSPQHYPIKLSHKDIRLILGITHQTFADWHKKGVFLHLNSNQQHTSQEVELLLINLRHNKTSLLLSSPTQNVNKYGQHYCNLMEIADFLNINYDNANKLSQTNLLKIDSIVLHGFRTKVTTYQALVEFNQKYILASALAKKLHVNATNITEKLCSIGIYPISGPHIDGRRLNIFTRESTVSLTSRDLTSIKEYPTLTGRRTKDATFLLAHHEVLSLYDVTKILELSPLKVAYLVRQGILAQDKTDASQIMILRESVVELLRKIHNDEFTSLANAVKLLNCSKSWLSEYWCKTGFLEIYDLIYWKMVKTSKLNAVIELRKTYMTGAEASAFLGMHHSHISNLQKQGIIKPDYLGSPEQIRLFKRDDVSKLKKLGYAKLAK